MRRIYSGCFYMFFLLNISISLSKAQSNTPNQTSQSLPKPVAPLPNVARTPQEIMLLTSGSEADVKMLLTLNNNRSEPMEVGLAAFSPAGNSVALPKLTLVSRESKIIDFNELLRHHHLTIESVSFLRITYTGVLMELGAQFTIYPIHSTSGIDSPRSLSVDFKSGKRASAFWLPNDAETLIAMTNASTSPINVTLRCGKFNDDLRLDPYATSVRRFQVEQILDGPRDFFVEGRAASCEAVSRGEASALRISGMITTPRGYTTPLRFYDPSSATSSVLAAPGLQSSANSIVVIHNTSGSRVSVVPIVAEAAAKDPQEIRLSPYVIEPQGDTRIDISQALQSFIARGADLVTLALNTDALPGSIVGALTQQSTKDGLIEDIPLRTSNPPRFDRGSYPLRWEDDYTNMVTITNTTAKSLWLRGAITAGNVVYVLTKTEVSPGGTAVFDVDKWRKERTPDLLGNTLPQDATYGKFLWSELSNGTNTGLIGRQSLASVRHSRRSSFSCGEECAYAHQQSPLFSFPIFISIPELTNSTSAMYEYYSSVNQPATYYPYTYNQFMMGASPTIGNGSVWTTGNTTLTSVSLIESALNPGSTTFHYLVDSIDDVYAPAAAECDHVETFDPQDGTVVSQTPTSAPITSNVKTEVSNGDAIDCVGNVLGHNEYGYRRCVAYQVKDQTGNPLQKQMTIHEDITEIGGNAQSPLHTGDGTSSAGGVFQDFLAIFNAGAPIPSGLCSVVKQVMSISGTTIRTNCIKFTTSDVTVTDISTSPSSCTATCP